MIFEPVCGRPHAGFDAVVGVVCVELDAVELMESELAVGGRQLGGLALLAVPPCLLAGSVYGIGGVPGCREDEVMLDWRIPDVLFPGEDESVRVFWCVGCH